MFVVLGNDHQAVSLDGGTPGHEEQAPKVRKPYTITKQRERWTEEEHRQFLEAIKLHGRAWRRIQEHIGTKTAVQIRSHAQKYFTKVVRESSDAADGEEKEDEEEQEPAFKPADIPPPRPKRKPSHPYPRKLRASPLLPPNMQERPTASPARLQSPMAMMRESGSPTSVLSAADGSDTTGALSLCSNAMHHCSSTASFNNASSNTASALTELQSVCPPRVSSVEGEAGSTSPCSRDSISFTLSLDNNATMKNNRNTPKEDAGTKACLKLFGKTVVIDKPHKEGYLEGNSITEQPPKSSLGQNLGLEDTMDLDNETPAVAGGTGNKGACKTPHHQNSPVQQPSIHHGLSPGPMLFYLPVPTDIKNASQQLPYCTNPVVPWLAFCGGMPFPPIHCAWEPSKMGGRNVAPDDQEVPKEEEDAQEEEEEGGSSEGSNSPTSDGGSSRNNCSVVNSGSQENRKPEKSVFSGSRPLRPFPKKSKGFVPYKKAVIPTSTEQQLGVTTQGEVDRNY